MKKSSVQIPGTNPVQYKLKFKTSMKSQNGRFEKCYIDYGGNFVPRASTVEKVIMVVGATGAGKSTLINGFANYLFGIEWEDNFRLRVIDANEDQSVSQTTNITAYTFPKVAGMYTSNGLTIIDTPEFGDTRGISRDREISTQIKEFFSVRGSEGIDQINGVLFVTPASSPRLTATQLYVFEAILGIFGNDIRDNIFLMTTFADGQKPKVLSAIKKAEVPYNQYFKFNNSALHADNIRDESDSDSEEGNDSFDTLSWKMGIKSFEKFFKKFDKVEPKSLVLTREVLREREHLQIIMKDMPKKIALGLTKMDSL